MRHCGKGSLVVSELLAQKLGIENPLVSYGNYTPYEGDFLAKPDSGRIQLIYSGSIDKVKNSAYMAVDVMPLLPDNYELKLSGPIAPGEEEIFRRALEDANQRCGRTACEYMGLLDEAQYSNLLLNSHIALNLQQEGTFGEYLFPSKILTYLAYNLPVVTTPGGSIVQSTVAKMLHFSRDFSLPEISNAIQGVDLRRNISYPEQLKKMEEDFTLALRQRIQNF